MYLDLNNLFNDVCDKTKYLYIVKIFKLFNNTLENHNVLSLNCQYMKINHAKEKQKLMLVKILYN